MKNKLLLLFILTLVLSTGGIIGYTQYLNEKYINQQLALIGRLSQHSQNEVLTYEFFKEDTKEDVQKGKEIIESTPYHQYALTSINNKYATPTVYLLVIAIIALLLFLIYRHYLSMLYLRKYSYHLEQILNAHYTPIKSNDPIIIQFNLFYEYFTKIKQESSLVKERAQWFVEDIAHQIKTPLTALRIYVDISKDPKTKEKGEKEIDRLQGVLEQLIYLAKLEAHAMTFHFNYQSLSSCIHEVCELLAPLINEKEIHIVEDMEDVSIYYDETWMFESFVNILKNAIEFSNQKETIEIKMVTLENKVIVEISDHGIMIPKEEQLHLFDRFYTTKNSHSRKNNAMGIGLNIAYEVIKAHHGNIYITSRVDKTSFIIELPLDCGKEKV